MFMLFFALMLAAMVCIGFDRKRAAVGFFMLDMVLVVAVFMMHMDTPVTLQF